MKINSTFQVSVFLMAVLMFSMPFIIFAEADSVAVEAKAAAINTLTEKQPPLSFAGEVSNLAILLVYK